MAVRYICISDLHLGAPYSVLTGINKDGDVDPEKDCPTLKTFAEGLDALLAELPVDSETRIVLLGDVLDMGFSETVDVVNTFKTFCSEVLKADNVGKLSRKILYLPGNHDHQLWRDEKSQHLLRQIQDGADSLSLFEVTKLLSPDMLESRLLRDIIESDADLNGYEVQIAYPNFAEVNDERAMVMHHGHYTESTYLAMSLMKQALYADLKMTNDIEVIERENGPWVNFLWSNIGNAGFGSDALAFYQTMLDPGGSHELVKRASAKISTWIAERFSTSDQAIAKMDKGLTINQLTRAVLDVGYGKMASTERTNYGDVLSDSSIEGVKWYLSGPVRNQFEEEQQTLPENVSFIFGHTHKPFQDQLPVDGYKAPVKVFNTGGWCVDKPVTSSVLGAAVVFVDDQLNVASLRLFNGAFNDEVAPTSAQGTGGYSDSTNPMLADLSAAVAATELEWSKFTEAASEAVELRKELARKRFFNPESEHGVLARVKP